MYRLQLDFGCLQTAETAAAALKSSFSLSFVTGSMFGTAFVLELALMAASPVLRSKDVKADVERLAEYSRPGFNSCLDGLQAYTAIFKM